MMHLRAILVAIVLLAAAGGAAPDTRRDNAPSELDTTGCPAGCATYHDCCKGQFCIAGGCIIGRKIEEALKVYDAISADISDDPNDYNYYYVSTDANGTKQKKDTYNCCPKKCGPKLPSCCKSDFCQLGECRGVHQP
ncbi:hypothetical protein BJY04DRAFT_220727 [Aspergillus karnatakaensis]|uniref:uncharacterized protein n=1 Tax=Aspergillus karnatakaensis TaxID=1810916 RepID=UPI003CCCD1F6